MGIIYLGSYQGETFITNTVKNTREMRVPITIENAMIFFNEFDKGTFVCLNTLYIAKHSIKNIMSIV